MFNPDSLRKQLSFLSDEALLEAASGDLTDVAKAIYDEEIAARGLSLSPAEDEAPAESPAGPAPEFPSPDAELVSIARFDTISEARLAITLLRNEDIPVWLAGATKPGQFINPNLPLDLVTYPEFLEAAQVLLDSGISDEELARLAEEAGQPPE